VRILLVEDEEDAARMLAKGLRERAFAVDVAADGETALAKASVNDYDLILLDVMLPGSSGLEVCGQLRRSGVATPVLMLTALDQVSDRITGLDSGADDYLGKPFDFNELLARIRALLRRGQRLEADVLEVCDVRVHTRARTVERAGRTLELTAKEYALLEYLARRKGEVVGRADISEHVWDETYDPFSNVIEVYVQRLRRKLEEGQTGPRLLHTRRGEGYRLGVAEPGDV
jgi:two-component system, OmpR family, copper resistance phosphate regulon response regulator CusR